MNVLGLFGFGMNPGACLLRDGALVAFAEEERFTRFKGSHGLFPGKAVRYCLAEGGLRLGDVDRVAFAWDTGKYPYRMLAAIGRQYLKHRRRASRGREGGGGALFTVLSNLLQYTPGRLREDVRFGLREQGLGSETPPIDFVPHHLCHSYSAYFCSPFRDAVVLTLDGSGEEICTQIAVGRGGRLTVEDAIPIPHSLGWFYAAFTAYLGFTPYQHEGKLMGLAGLGHARSADNPWPERLSRVLRVEDGTYEVDPIYTRFGGHSYAERFTDALADLITGFDRELGPVAPGELSGSNGSARSRYLAPGYVDLAWGVQKKLEEAAKAVAEGVARRTGIPNLCIAGGVGLNCKMNGALLAETSFERVFVQPASYDAGAAIGAAMVVAESLGDPIHHPLERPYLGPGFGPAEIRGVLDACKLPAEECADVAARVADELAAGKLVGWFQGRMELGPRALGGRSILANPELPGVRDLLNLRVKSREPWRPFCPSILDEARGDYFEHASDAPFMTLAFSVREERRAEMDAVSHVDHTARPQCVTPEATPRFHRLLAEFRERTGLPYVVNTSFNVSGEPIVCSPLDAVRCFYSSGLDVLALGDFVLTKK